MNILDLAPQQLKRTASIKEKLNALNREIRNLLDGASSNGAASSKKRTMSAASKTRKLRLRSGHGGRSADARERKPKRKVFCYLT